MGGWRQGGAAHQPQLRDRPAVTPLLAVADVHCRNTHTYAGQTQQQPIALLYQSIIASSGLLVDQGGGACNGEVYNLEKVEKDQTPVTSLRYNFATR